jgi:hypothetical protein
MSGAHSPAQLIEFICDRGGCIISCWFADFSAIIGLEGGLQNGVRGANLLPRERPYFGGGGARGWERGRNAAAETFCPMILGSSCWSPRRRAHGTCLPNHPPVYGDDADATGAGRVLVKNKALRELLGSERLLIRPSRSGPCCICVAHLHRQRRVIREAGPVRASSWAPYEPKIMGTTRRWSDSGMDPCHADVGSRSTGSRDSDPPGGYLPNCWDFTEFFSVEIKGTSRTVGILLNFFQ